MTVDNIERKRWATEWDMGWFCTKCDKLIHWKKKAYVINNKPYCRECSEKILKKT